MRSSSNFPRNDEFLTLLVQYFESVAPILYVEIMFGVAARTDTCWLEEAAMGEQAA